MITELNGSGTLQVTSQGMRGVRIFRVHDYAEAEGFAQSLLGVAFQVGGVIERTVPARFAPGSSLFCTQARIEGLGQPGEDPQGQPTYSGGAKVTATYETLSYDPDKDDQKPNSPGPYLTESLSISGRFVSLPKEAFQWESDGEPLSEDDVAPGQIVPQAEYRLTRHKVPELPKEALFAAIGKLNAAGFAQVDAETLLFLGAEARREHTSAGAESWEIELHFNYAPEGHNSELRTSTGAFDEVVTKVGGNKRYPTVDFAALVPEVQS